MNITTQFFCMFPESLLLNVDNSIGDGWSGERLFNDVFSISRALRNADVKAGDRVIILGTNSVETYAFSLALWNIGAVAVPLHPFTSVAVLAGIINAISPVMSFVEGKLPLELESLIYRQCRSVVYVTGPSQGPTYISYSTFLNIDGPQMFGNFDGSHPALIIHTSGSQGLPKAIHLSHQNLFNYFHYHDLVHRQFSDKQAFGVQQKPFISVFHPSHLAGYSIALQGLLMRRPTYLVNGFVPRTFLSLLSSLKCRLVLLVPSMYVALLKEVELIAQYDFSHLELCGSVGEPTPEALVQRIEETFGVTVFLGYGLTECLPGIAHSWEDLQNRKIKRGSSGKLLFPEAKLIDEHGNEANAGELWLRNPTVHRCYADAKFNDAKFTDDGWLKTGDLFHRDDAGWFFHKGRIDDMFICNGKNIYPAEIEFVLIKHPAIERVVAAPITDKDGKLVPAALIQTQLHGYEKEALDFFLKAGPLHAAPQFILCVRSLPELGPGKVDRKSSKALLQASFDQA